MEKIEFILEALSEDISPFDQLSPLDAQRVVDDLNAGNEWAWCCVKVTAFFQGAPLTGTAYLGGCNYESEEDFMDGGYYEELCSEASDDLIRELRHAAQALKLVTA